MRQTEKTDDQTVDFLLLYFRRRYFITFYKLSLFVI